jgi:hypothetical protein
MLVVLGACGIDCEFLNWHRRGKVRRAQDPRRDNTSQGDLLTVGCIVVAVTGSMRNVGR